MLLLVLRYLWPLLNSEDNVNVILGQDCRAALALQSDEEDCYADKRQIPNQLWLSPSSLSCRLVGSSGTSLLFLSSN
ncbi:hypothetical protein SLE2022_005340 [Rubroshorea leprosula]